MRVGKAGRFGNAGDVQYAAMGRTHMIRLLQGEDIGRLRGKDIGDGGFNAGRFRVTVSAFGAVNIPCHAFQFQHPCPFSLTLRVSG